MEYTSKSYEGSLYTLKSNCGIYLKIRSYFKVYSLIQPYWALGAEATLVSFAALANGYAKGAAWAGALWWLRQFGSSSPAWLLGDPDTYSQLSILDTIVLLLLLFSLSVFFSLLLLLLLLLLVVVVVLVQE